MFRVSFFVDDRKLGDSLRALAGMIQGSPEVQPVVNAEVGKNGKLAAKTSGTAAALFMDYLGRRKLKEVNAGVAQEFLKGIGRAPGSATYVIKKVIKLGGLKKTPGTKGSSTTYQVQRGKS
jgi:hypothetical protein